MCLIITVGGLAKLACCLIVVVMLFTLTTYWYVYKMVVTFGYSVSNQLFHHWSWSILLKIWKTISCYFLSFAVAWSQPWGSVTILYMLCRVAVQNHTPCIVTETTKLNGVVALCYQTPSHGERGGGGSSWYKWTAYHSLPDWGLSA